MHLYIGLIHYPVYNRNRQRIASAITTVDIHDIARVARTYDAVKFFVINPLATQQALAKRIVQHWTAGHGAQYNRDRKEAMGLVEVVSTVDEAVHRVAELEGEIPLLIATDACRHGERSISYTRARDIIEQGRSVILGFGTAWGLDEAFMEKADHVLDPILGRTGYNHLSVRTAAAITLDRLAGRQD
jgi:hypothetical protein